MNSDILRDMSDYGQTTAVIPVVEGLLIVKYFGELIALVDHRGNFIWRDENYPVFLIDYLIQNPLPENYRWN